MPYVQFFTVHGLLNGYVLKLACGLLAHKNAASYERVFRVIDARMHMITGQHWVPIEMVTDFELWILQAA